MPPEGLTISAVPTQPTPLNPGLLDSIDNALNNLASAASNKKAILEQLIASNSSLPTSNSNLTKEVKTLRDHLAAKSRRASAGWLAAMTEATY